jgi:hypothetical protein
MIGAVACLAAEVLGAGLVVGVGSSLVGYQSGWLIGYRHGREAGEIEARALVASLADARDDAPDAARRLAARVLK